MPHKTWRGLLPTLVLGLLLGACGQLPISKDLNSQVERQVALGNFSRAIALVEASGLDKQQQRVYLDRIRQTQKQTQADIGQGRSEVEDLIADDRWLEAKARLQRLLQQYPQNLELRRYQAEVARRHKTRGLVLEAEWLVGQLEQTRQARQNFIQRARVDNKQPETLYYDQAMRKYSQRLADIALRLAKADELVLAKQFSLIARAAFDSDYIRRRHDKVLALIQGRSGALLATMEQDYAQALENGELERAREIMKRMLILAPDNKQYLAQQKQLEQRIQVEVASLLERGRRYYAEGDIDQAIKAFEKGLRLAPDHRELREQLNHAYKARATVERIRRQQGQ